MAEKYTDIVCILDRSGSMSMLVNEVINSFNTFLKEQQELPDPAKLTLVLFDDHYEVIHDRIKIKNVPELTQKEYFSRGMTAMNDAIGKAIKSIKKNKKKVIVLIQTDGLENASQEYNNADIKKMVTDCEEKGWTFIFHGANIDSFEEGNQRGFASANTINFASTNKGVADSYSTLSAKVTSYRGSVGKNIDNGAISKMDAQNAAIEKAAKYENDAKQKTL